MALPTVSSTNGRRARRWDALVLGSGLTALMAAIRLGRAGHRVLIVEEAARRDAYAGLKEPFCLAGARDQGVLDAALREVAVPLIDRRRMEPRESAFQVIAPELRAEVGESRLTARELAIWGLLPHGEARALAEALKASAEAERQAMLEAPLVRVGKRGARRPPAHATHLRGLPAEFLAAMKGGPLTRYLECQVRALSNLADAQPSPEAKARLLGGAQQGGVSFSHQRPALVSLLRQRVEGAFGEFRTTPAGFSIVESGHQGRSALTDSEELWLGRALVIATPISPLAAVLDQDPIPDFLRPRVHKRRIQIHLQCPRALLPEGMGERLVLTGDWQAAPKGPDPVSLSVFAHPQDDSSVDLVAQAVVEPDCDIPSTEDAIEERVRELLRFAGADMKRQPVERPRWDDDGWLEDPASGAGWPGEMALRVSSRPPVYRLDRSEVAGLGIEGDLLLGWRAGDAIAADLR